jgi:hypothetical protein
MDTLAVIDMDKVTKDKTPRVDVPVSSLSVEGCTARARAMLEGERRFCGNQGEVILGTPVLMNKMERISMLLDLRTAGGAHVSKNVYIEAKKDLKAAYVEFGLQCLKHDALLCAKEKEKEFHHPSKTSSQKPKMPASRKGFAFVPGCAHDTDEDSSGSDSSDDSESRENDCVASKTAELEKDFGRAWKNWKQKMQSIQWTEVITII